MFLDVSFIGGDGFQKDYIFLKVENTTVGSKKKSYKARLISSVSSERRNDTRKTVEIT